uniref:Uncharacterized protein n=1 Tax=Timema monikensis TaxID=170555 RepID=A0A7R9EH16_9NEOP|nr:unnamed protein product [Timema monikensis]
MRCRPHYSPNPALRELLVNDPEGDHSQMLRSRRDVSVATTPARNTVISSSSSFPNGAYSGSISASGAGGGQDLDYIVISKGRSGVRVVELLRFLTSAVKRCGEPRQLSFFSLMCALRSGSENARGAGMVHWGNFPRRLGVSRQHQFSVDHTPMEAMEVQVRVMVLDLVPFQMPSPNLWDIMFFRQMQALAQQHSYAQRSAYSSYGNGNFGTSSSSGNDGGLGFNPYIPEYRVGGFGPGFFKSPEAFGGNSNPNVNEGFIRTPGNDENVGAFATANITPQGGHGTVGVLPGLATRFSSDDGGSTPPNGNSFGVFTSSSSGSSDVNGKKTSYKTATSAINDNGKITVRWWSLPISSPYFQTKAISRTLLVPNQE